MIGPEQDGELAAAPTADAAAAVVLVVMAFTMLGNALDDVLNPKALSRR